jgi:hypothetical protein
MGVCVVASVLLMAGCMGGADGITDRYKDADKRFTNAVGGMEQTTKTVSVPAGTSSLTVKASYSVGGTASFTLKNPSGGTVNQDSGSGGKVVEDDQWYTTSNPQTGDWTLTISVQGGATYAFGFYY